MKPDSKFLVDDLYKTYHTVFGVPQPIVDEWKELDFLFNEEKYLGWGSMIKFTQEVYAVSDALSTCRFTSPWRFGIGPQLYAQAIECMIKTYEFNWTKVLQVGERINAMEKALITKYAGFPNPDTLPNKFFRGKNALSRFHFGLMKLYFYGLCSYTKAGIPTPPLLDRLIHQYEEEEKTNHEFLQ